jgi:hypothetical protein
LWGGWHGVTYVPHKRTVPQIPWSRLFAFENLAALTRFMPASDLSRERIQVWRCIAEDPTPQDEIVPVNYLTYMNAVEFWNEIRYTDSHQLPRSKTRLISAPSGTLACRALTLTERLL